jgi:acetoacetyl-CoA synthetase
VRTQWLLLVASLRYATRTTSCPGYLDILLTMSETMSHPKAEVLWRPSAEGVAESNLTRYLGWLAETRGLRFADYAALWSWSTEEPGEFWSSIAEFYGVRFHSQASEALSSWDLPGARWFPGATLNYAEMALASVEGDAILFEGEGPQGKRREETVSRAELRRRVALVAAWLRTAGVKKGDCVAGYLANTPETVVAFLAAASVGAIWSNTPAEMSSGSVLDRLAQIEPKVLFATCGYWYGGKRHERASAVAEIAAGLPSLRELVLVPGGDDEVSPAVPVPCHRWADLVAAAEIPALQFEPVPFEHPLWILYSSGTTGKPKAIVHGHGGILLEHLKVLSLHLDLRTGDRFFWYTTSGWMMWNLLVSGLLLPGVTVVLYDGSPKQPDFMALWEFVERQHISYFGASAPYFMACRKEGIEPGARFGFERLRGVGSTGAPLPVEGFRWIYEQVKRDVLLGSVSGGTDVCSAFVLSHPHLPVHAGKLQCLGLGAKIEAWNEKRESMFGQVGELVLSAPFPAMPVFLWNDPGDARMRASYFEKFPGAWSHGDWIEIDATGGPCVIHGRSDATLNRGGVRMGTVEFYAIVEALPEIAEALVIDTCGLGREDRLLLFVALRPGAALDDALRAKIVQKLRTEVSPRHVPDAIHEVAEIPHTLNGKKLEVPVKRILAGMPVENAVSRATVSNPEALDFFIRLAEDFNPKAT